MTMKTPENALRSGWRVRVVGAALATAILGTGGFVSGLLAQTTTAPASTDTHAQALDAFRKARVFYNEGNYADADTANNRALKLDPTLNEAKLLHKVLREKVGNGNTGSATAAGESDGAPATTGPSKMKALTMEQVSMIRLQELSSTDTQVRGRIPRKALDEFWNKYMKVQTGVDLSQGAYNTFVSPSNFMGQVHSIKDSNLQEFAESVEIGSDPSDMVAFRTAVEPYVLQNCATSACHGGDKAGNFHLLRPGSSSLDQVIYTNFYIMSQYHAKDGGKMIDRDDPDDSLFLQYGLPKTVAHFAHPAVPGPTQVRPHFGDKNAPEYQVMVAWVKSLAFPKPNYGVVYEIPGMTAAPTAPVEGTKSPSSPAAK